MELLIENALNIGSNEFYRAIRYDISLVVMLINTEDRQAFEILESNIRQTDIIQQLDPCIIILFLTHTSVNEANAFLKNMHGKFDFTHTMAKFEDYEHKFLTELFAANESKVPC